MRGLRSATLALALAACGEMEGDPLGDAGPLAAEAVATAHTTRLPADDPVAQAIVLTQTVYPVTREENAPGALILSPQDPALAFTAMQRVTHMPVNAPLLYLELDGSLGERTLREMRRLRPEGVMQDGNVQVYVVGDVAPEVVAAIATELDYKIRVFDETDPIALAELLDRWQAALKSDHPDEVAISAIDHPEGILHGLGPMGWNAHMGRGFAWVHSDRVPDETRAILERRFGEAFIYLTGGPDVISDEVARELGRYGLVRRVAGPTPPATSAVNAGYKDYGINWGWWWSTVNRQFGWGVSEAGHNFIIASVDDPLGAIPAALLGHMGKHGPLLLVEPDAIPEPVADYLEMVRPFPAAPSATVLNHAWIVGGEDTLSLEVQFAVDRLLRPVDTLPERRLEAFDAAARAEAGR